MSLLENMVSSNGTLLRVKDSSNPLGWSPLLPVTKSKFVIEDNDKRFVSQLEKNRLSALYNGFTDNSGNLSVSANLITTGELDAGKVKIIGSNGRIVLFDNYIRISTYENRDGNPIPELYERIFLGIEEDSEGNEIAKLVVRDENGETAILDHTGLTKVAFTDGWNKTENGSLNAAKIDIDSLITGINDNGQTVINSNKIYMDNKTLDVAFREMVGVTVNLSSELEATAEKIEARVEKTTYEQYVSNMNSTIEELRNNINYKIEIFSSNGEFFRNHIIQTTLTGIVYKGGNDVTSNFDSSWFKWTRTSNDNNSDTIWNNSHSTGSKSINITSDDVYKKATFTLSLEKPI